MSLEENKAIVRSFFEAVNRRNLAVVDELIAPDYVDHTLQRRGLEDLKQFLKFLFKTFPKQRRKKRHSTLRGSSRRKKKWI